MNNKIYWAKSNPQETIQEHTDKLLENLNLLTAQYPSLFSSWDTLEMLKLACLYHDLGKINSSFQKLITTGKGKQEVPHALYSIYFLDGLNLYKKTQKKYIEEGEDGKIAKQKAIEFVKIIAYAIAYHHEREFSKEIKEIIEKNLENLQLEAKNFEYDKIENLKIEKISKNFFSFGSRVAEPNKSDKDYEAKTKFFDRYVLVKGLLNRIDYASSAGIDVEKKNDFLQKKLEEMLNNWKEKNSNASWNELQEYMIKKRDKNIVAIAQTGMGKTEAGLLWIGDTKGFFVLPLKTAINAIYKRVKDRIVKDDIENKVGLLHSETKDIYIEDFSNTDLLSYYESTKQLSLPLTICTLDQIFDFVYRYKGFEPKLATLAYSKIVLDEIQMYSPDLLAYVVKGLKYITRLGGKFAILTATFPRLVEDLLRNEGIEFEVSKNFIKNDLNLRHNVEVKEEVINSEFITSKFQNNKVLVICNTVKEAQRIYDELKEELPEADINLLHSRFTKKDRREKEESILKLGKSECEKSGIWITTQVVEASLDIDFDILITELSDLNGLFQRMGRCYRNRKLEKDTPNCYVFVGREEVKNTGVGYVIDKEIYQMSRELIMEKISGNITEEEKMKYIEELYTTTNLKKTKYYEKLKDTLEYLELLAANEKTKIETQKEFRDISNCTIIPKSVYEENIDEINANLEILKSSESQYSSKILAKLKIKDLTVSVPVYDLKKQQGNLEKIELSKYEQIDIIDGDYSTERGFSSKKLSTEEKIEDRFL